MDATEKSSARQFRIELPRGRALVLGQRTLVMGVVNVTPDSFSDGGRFNDTNAAVQHALRLIDEGADILDIGGESTRPGAKAVSVSEELNRVIPVIERIARFNKIPISIDTSKAEVAREALAAGASIVNDITGFRVDASIPRVAAEAGAAAVVMHIKGTPRTMQKNPVYADLIGEIKAYLSESIRIGAENGLPAEKVIIDPGIGFGKTVSHNLEIMARLEEFSSLGRPILVGTSRKSTIGAITRKPVSRRIFGTAATLALCIRNGAHILRVHDVAAAVDVAKMADAICSVIRRD